MRAFNDGHAKRKAAFEAAGFVIVNGGKKRRGIESHKRTLVKQREKDRRRANDPARRAAATERRRKKRAAFRLAGLTCYGTAFKSGGPTVGSLKAARRDLGFDPEHPASCPCYDCLSVKLKWAVSLLPRVYRVAKRQSLSGRSPAV